MQFVEAKVGSVVMNLDLIDEMQSHNKPVMSDRMRRINREPKDSLK